MTLDVYVPHRTSHDSLTQARPAGHNNDGAQYSASTKRHLPQDADCKGVSTHGQSYRTLHPP
jgi:hypothetical protein